MTELDRDAYHAVRRGGVVEFARSQVHAHGKCSQEVWQYWRAVLPASYTDAQITQCACDLEWCGVFALWCYHREGLTSVPWRLGRGFAIPNLTPTAAPQPGDLVIFHRFVHHAIVDRIEGGALYTIDGNQSPGVELRSRKLAKAGVAGYYSITGWIDAALARDTVSG